MAGVVWRECDNQWRGDPKSPPTARTAAKPFARREQLYEHQSGMLNRAKRTIRSARNAIFCGGVARVVVWRALATCGGQKPMCSRQHQRNMASTSAGMGCAHSQRQDIMRPSVNMHDKPPFWSPHSTAITRRMVVPFAATQPREQTRGMRPLLGPL